LIRINPRRRRSSYRQGMDRTAKRTFVLLAIAAALPLLGCTSLADVAAQRCRRFPAGSAAYKTCWQREYWGQMREMEEQNQKRIEIERRGRGP
jgi:hypothetical protein